MVKRTGYTKNIFFSLIISVLILFGIGFLSVKYLIPIYDLKSQDIYKFMIYLLPIIIGVTFLEIGSMVASKNEENKDTYDQLPINSYDEPFYNQLFDDPMKTKVSKTDVHFTPVAQSKENIRKDFEEFTTINQSVVYPTDLPVELQKQLLALDSKQASEVLEYINDGKTLYESNFDSDLTKQLLSLNEEDAQKVLYWLSEDAILVNPDSIDSADISNLPQNIQSKLLNLSDEDADKALYWLSQDPILVDASSIDSDEVELPFDNETSQAILNFSKEDAHKAVEYITRGFTEEIIHENYTDEFDSSVETILKNEIESAKDLGYDVSLVLLNINGKEDKAQIDLFLTNVNSSCYSFVKEDGIINLIFPFYNRNETKSILEKVFKNIYHTFKYGLTTLNERYDIEVPQFIDEALTDYNSK
ncbi:MAG: hypothetical protein JJE21_05180 [Spirochaetaceae bacterium]|nr:hypothetical protein [Spirochaetaceae bacterium]